MTKTSIYIHAARGGPNILKDTVSDLDEIGLGNTATMYLHTDGKWRYSPHNEHDFSIHFKDRDAALEALAFLSDEDFALVVPELQQQVLAAREALSSARRKRA